MVKQPNESIYVKSSNRINAMRQVYEMRYMQNLSIPEIISKTGIKQTQIYRFLHTFASEYPDLVEQMKKNSNEVTPDEYKKLLEEVSTLKSQLKREKLRADFYEEMVAFGKEVYGIDLKKAGTK
jgi:predicted DNA-binding transcriptional regulator AlpA